MSGHGMNLKETCVCGASLSLVSTWASDVTREAARWRTDHRHEFPPSPKPERVRIPIARRRA